MLNTSNLRPMRTKEREALTQLLTTLPIPRKRWLKAALNTAVFFIFSLAGMCIAWFILSLIVSASINIDIGISSTYSSIVFSISCFFAFLIAYNSTKQWLNTTIDDYALVAADIKANQTVQSTYTVIDVKCFKEPELGGLLYLLRLREQHSDMTQNKSKHSVQDKIRVIYDYESQNSESNRSDLITIKETLILSHAPRCQFIFSNTFEGINIDNISHQTLAIPPKLWPDADSWLSMSWDELDTSYSQH